MYKVLKNEKFTEKMLLHTEVRTQRFKPIVNKDGSLPGLHTKHLYVSMFNCS